MSATNKILTRQTNRGFEIRKPQQTTAEQEKALRDELHVEIENKTKACSNIAFDCSLPRVDGFEYCLKHILQDPRAPYKQCAFVYSTNGKRCLQPAPKYDPKKDQCQIITHYCFEHSRLTQLNKTRAAVGKYKRIETNETILDNLRHHVNLEQCDQLTGFGRSGIQSPFNDSIENDVDVEKPFLDPFMNIDIESQSGTGRKILDYASDTESDLEVTTLLNTWNDNDMDNSDNESVDSQNEDLLKHAGIYTTEEATAITKQKMVRLQKLYIEQIYRLQHLLREKRRKYLHSMRAEKDLQTINVIDQPHEIYQERKMLAKLKALNKFHTITGPEALLHRKFVEKRAKAKEGLIQRPSFHTKCIYTEGGVKCGDRIIPCSKYCRKHILEDKRQIFYRACSVEKSGVVCQDPVPNIFDDSTCVLHIDLPVQQAYTKKKDESDTEDEEATVTVTGNTVGVVPSPTSKSKSGDMKTAMECDQSTDVTIDNNVTICHDGDD